MENMPQLQIFLRPASTTDVTVEQGEGTSYTLRLNHGGERKLTVTVQTDAIGRDFLLVEGTPPHAEEIHPAITLLAIKYVITCPVTAGLGLIGAPAVGPNALFTGETVMLAVSVDDNNRHVAYGQLLKDWQQHLQTIDRHARRQMAEARAVCQALDALALALNAARPVVEHHSRIMLDHKVALEGHARILRETAR